MQQSWWYQIVADKFVYKNYNILELSQLSPKLYSVSLSSGSEVVRLFAKRSAKSRTPREIAHTGSRTRKNKESVHALKSCVCVLTSLPEGSEQAY